MRRHLCGAWRGRWPVPRGGCRGRLRAFAYKPRLNLRKLGASGRVQAAALAEHAGLLPPGRLNTAAREAKDPRAPILDVCPIRGTRS